MVLFQKEEQRKELAVWIFVLIFNLPLYISLQQLHVNLKHVTAEKLCAQRAGDDQTDSFLDCRHIQRKTLIPSDELYKLS